MTSLVKKAQKGDEDAFYTLFTEFQGIIYRIAFVYVKNKEDALDIVQETAFRSFKSIKSLKEPRYIKTWLTKIAVRCSLDFLGKSSKVIFMNPEDFNELSSNAVMDEDIHLRLTLDDVLNKLTEHEKTIVLMRFYEEFTFKEISEVLDIPLGTTKTVLYRALQRMKNNLVEGKVYET